MILLFYLVNKPISNSWINFGLNFYEELISKDNESRKNFQAIIYIAVG